MQILLPLGKAGLSLSILCANKAREVLPVDLYLIYRV